MIIVFAFYREYYGDRPKLLVEAIIAYAKYNGSHNKDEHYLKELLKMSTLHKSMAITI